jgi:GGDEF domain-containing protein
VTLLDRLQKPAESGIEAAISDAVKLAILALTGAIFNFFLAHLAGPTTTFWASKKFAVYEVAIWVCVSATASAWITHSIMRRKLRRIEEQAEKREQDAKELSELDAATGLLNLRALNERLPRLVEQSVQTKEPLTMVIFDIDGFKGVNTLVGHDRGNDILKEVAACLLPRGLDQAFRYPENADRKTRSVVFRYGGDEFIILALNTAVKGGTDPGTGKKVFHGSRMAEVLQKNVWDIDFRDLATKRRERNEPSKVTVSAGIADTNLSLDPEVTASELTRRAEVALIEAKRINGEMEQKDETFRGTLVPYSIDLDRSS